MNPTGRASTTVLGVILAGLATLAVVHTLARNWQGCDTHLEPGGRGALLFLMLPFLLLLLAAGALAGRATRLGGLRQRFEDPELLRLVAVVGGIVLTAITVVTLLRVDVEPCPLV
ncbi:hypothetical protein ACIQBJ_34100 [Kitasatospora sp. NPDC088391]|uniref:hypothetical protein n=1 Tax=Kitasatospora sp. NPDC088391 TaxID=3364074 RepID=UPI00380EB79D